ncbi:HAMP domain-containing sensor histidine kinase [Fulvivirga sp.]|uniref:sensor histidine kinase n=1 Tax=Fulvivirga sp. TaxID=1931237 RepID=UPI0032EFFBCD
MQEQLLTKKNQELERVNKEKTQIINIVAHDLKSPLTRIEGLLNVIEFSNENLTHEQLELLNKAKKVSVEQKNMVIKLMDQGLYLKAQLRPDDFEAILLINEISSLIDEFRISADQKKINIVEEYYVREVKIVTQKTYLKAALENLLSNALKFSNPETSVHVKIEVNHNSVVISIVDEGSVI